MLEYEVDVSFCDVPVLSSRVVSVMKMFGVDVHRLKNSPVSHKCKIHLGEGDVCFITGASGAGKSVVLKSMYEQTQDDLKINLNDIVPETKGSVIDHINGDVFDALRMLSFAGISDVMSVLQNPNKLSDGQKYRYKLAKVLSQNKKVIFADEFCSNLDRVTACVIAYHIKKFAKRTNTIFILASGHDDLLSDLRPDVVVIKQHCGDAEVVYKNEGIGDRD